MGESRSGERAHKGKAEGLRAFSERSHRRTGTPGKACPGLASEAEGIAMPVRPGLLRPRLRNRCVPAPLLPKAGKRGAKAPVTDLRTETPCRLNSDIYNLKMETPNAAPARRPRLNRKS